MYECFSIFDLLLTVLFKAVHGSSGINSTETTHHDRVRDDYYEVLYLLPVLFESSVQTKKKIRLAKALVNSKK